MAAFRLFFLACLLAFPAIAKGGVQQFQYDSGYSFRDVIGQTYSTNYGWYGNQIVDPSRAVYQGSSSPSRFPNSTVAWQIQAGDDGAGDGHNRDEVAEMFSTNLTDESPSSGTKYYALSVYIPSGWVDPAGSPAWFIVAQLHGSDSNIGHSSQAMFQFLLASDQNTAKHYALRTVGGPVTAGTGSVPTADDVITDLGAHVYDTWVDFVFKVTWGSDVEGTGHVTVWKRVVGTDAALNQIADYASPTLYSSSGVTETTAYWKHGIYRGDNGTQPTTTIYMGPLCRANSFRDAATCAFGQYP